MECPMCKTREMLKQAEKIIDDTPVIDSPLYADTIAELLNSISNAMSVFGCFCEPVTEKGQTS